MIRRLSFAIAAFISAGCFEPPALDPSAAGVARVTRTTSETGGPASTVAGLEVRDAVVLNVAKTVDRYDSSRPRRVAALSFTAKLPDGSEWVAACQLEQTKDGGFGGFHDPDSKAAHATVACELASRIEGAKAWKLHARAVGDEDFTVAGRLTGGIEPNDFKAEASVEGVDVTRVGLSFRGTGARWELRPYVHTAKIVDGRSRESMDLPNEVVGRIQLGEEDLVQISAGLDPDVTTAANLVVATAIAMDGPLDLRMTEIVDPTGTAAKSPAVEVAVSRSHVCFRRANGTVSCRAEGATFEPGVIGAKALALGQGFGCAIVAESAIEKGGVVCWMMDERDGTTQLLGVREGFKFMTATAVPGLAGVKQLALDRSDGRRACALTAAGDVLCWGDMTDWGGVTPVPQLVPRGHGAKQIFMASIHCDGLAGVVDGGAITTLMNPTRGCDFAADKPVQSHVTLGADLKNVEELAVAGGSACVITAERTVKCWGHNDAGQFGYETKARSGWEPAQTEPKEVPGLSGVKSLVAGDRHMCALHDSGRVSCWGRNSDGQLGDGGTHDRVAPAPVQGIEDAVQISGSLGMTCAVKKSGAVVCWGRGGGFESVLRAPTVVE